MFAHPILPPLHRVDRLKQIRTRTLNRTSRNVRKSGIGNFSSVGSDEK